MSLGSVKISVSKVFADVVPSRPPSYWDYEELKVTWSSPAPYKCCESIGKGKYSEVFRGVNKYNNQPCVIKILKPVKTLKVKREISILQNLCGGPNIVQLLDLVKEPHTNTPCLILEWTDNQDFKVLYPSFSVEDIAFYMYKVLEALNYCHSQGIIHRDIKPHNIMIEPDTRKLRLIDWGLAEFYHPQKQYNVRVATRYFKAPELLVDYKYYDYALDMWSFGCLVAGIVFQKEPFFHGTTIDDQLVVISKVLGTDGLLQYLRKYNIMLDEKYDGKILNYPQQPWKHFIKRKNRHRCTPEIIDLIDKLLVYDHQERLTAEEAMRHPFFAREHANAKKQQRGTSTGSPKRRPETKETHDETEI